jgi:DNA-binding transcriptional MerR regulator
LIRIGELSRRLGVSADRLRAWERRYGLLRPVRTSGGFRLYSGDDERRVRAMQRHLAEGLSAAEAAMAVLAAGGAGAGSRPADAADLRRELGEALAALDAIRAHEVVDRMLADLGSDDAMRAVIFPFLHDLGDRWARAEIRVDQEHFASNLLQGRLLALLRATTDGDGPMALLACPPGEFHTLGLVGFGVALRNRGWRITYLGADSPIADVREASADVDPTVVVVSAAMPSHFLEVQDELRELALDVRLALAGAGASPLVAERVGAQLLHGDPVTAADGMSEALISAA